MNCCWKELLALLPPSVRCEVMAGEDKLKDTLLEIRLRVGQAPQLVTKDGCLSLSGQLVGNSEIAFCVNHVSGFSAYTAASAGQGYLTARGGHRVGLCGTAVVQQGTVTGMKEVSSLCIRVARDMEGIAGKLLPWADLGSILLIGPPGSGKTTLLRDLIRQISQERGDAVAVVDERCEIFPMSGRGPEFFPGPKTDVLSGCPKACGMELVLRSMGPKWIAVDEISSLEDCSVMEQCGYCGVSFLATAHAANAADLKRRPVYRKLVDSGIFGSVAILGSDKRYTVERLKP